jgi:tetratricopeptide (TPR) repeat protein
MKGEEKLWQLLSNNLETLRASNRLPEAIRVGETALDLARRIFPENDPLLALSYERLGEIHDQQNNRAQAKPLLIKALAILEQAEPPDPRAIYRSARRLAHLCDVLGQQQEAIVYYKKAIKTGTQLEDVLHSDLGTLLNNVALIYRKSGRSKAAEPYYLHALEIYEKHLGTEHSDVASVLNNLGVFYTNERRFEEAERAQLRALAIREKVHSSAHPDIAQSKCNLAVVYHSRGDYVKAGDLYRASLKTWEEATEVRPEDYAIVASNYADLLRSLGKARKAASIESRARKKRAE